MKIISVIHNVHKRIGLFELLVLIVLVAVGMFAQSFLFSKGDTVYVRMRVVDRDIQYIDEGMPLSRVANKYEKGLVSKDGLGRVTAEVVKVEGFDRKYNSETFTEKEDVYIVMKLSASYSQRSHGYKYQGMTIASGEWLNVNFGELTAHGFIVDVSRDDFGEKREFITLRALYQSGNEVNGETDQYFADAIAVGDTVRDAGGNVIAEVTEKRVEPLRIMTVDQYGIVHTTYHTLKKSMFLTLRIFAEKREDEYYYQDSITVKTGGTLPLFLPKLILYTKILSFDEK